MDNTPLNQYGLVSTPPTSPLTPVGVGTDYAPGSVNAVYTGGVITNQIAIVSQGNAARAMYINPNNITNTLQGMWIGSDKFATAPFSVDLSGNLVANSATIQGNITAGTIAIGTSPNWFRVDSSGNMWLGAATFGSAPASISNAGAATFSNVTITGGSLTIGANFSVTSSGVLTASSATITGNITANTLTANSSGTIGGFTIASTTLSATNLTLTSGSSNVANISVGTGANLAGMNAGASATDVAFWAGSTYANRATAPFVVQENGTVTATNATITGVIQTGASGQRIVMSSAVQGGFPGNQIAFYNSGGTAIGAIFVSSSNFNIYDNSTDTLGPDFYSIDSAGFGLSMQGNKYININSGGSHGSGVITLTCVSDAGLPPANTNVFKINANAISFFQVALATRQTGGALTAGAAYGANEQTMLNNVFKGMQAYGLLT